MLRIVAGVLLCCALALPACQTNRPPKGDSGGRVDPYRQTNADRYSREVSSVTLLEFADQVSQALSERVAHVDEITESETKVALEMGAITNNTSTPSNDFKIIRRKVFMGLVNNSIVTQHANVYESPELMDEQADRFGSGENTDLFDDGPPATPTDRYAAEDTYVLQGEFGEITRGRNQSTYVFDVTLTNLASRRVVFAEQFTSKELR